MLDERLKVYTFYMAATIPVATIPIQTTPPMIGIPARDPALASLAIPVQFRFVK